MPADLTTPGGGEVIGSTPHVKIYLRIIDEGKIALGPGKADLMEAIDTQGSLSKAGMVLGISYRRVWSMVEEINNGFELALVLTSQGGVKGGGARLSDTGRIVLNLYRRMQADVAQTAAAHFDGMKSYLKTKT